MFGNSQISIGNRGCELFETVRERLHQDTCFTILGSHLLSCSGAVRELLTITRTSAYFNVFYVFSENNTAR